MSPIAYIGEGTKNLYMPLDPECEKAQDVLSSMFEDLAKGVHVGATIATFTKFEIMHRACCAQCQEYGPKHIDCVGWV